MSASERAIVQLVVEGAEQFDAANQKIQADLTATERAGKQAETAVAAMAREAREAESQARRLTATLTKTFSAIQRGINLAQRAAEFAGVNKDSTEGVVLDAAQAGISGAAEGYRYGRYFGTEAAIVTATLAGVYRATESVAESAARLERVARKREDDETTAIVDSLVRQAGLGEIEHVIAPRGRRVQ